jgi:hypothetical protein
MAKEFRSALEAGIAAQLEAAGVEYQYEPYKLEYKRRVTSGVCDSCGRSPVSQRRKYLPDFVVGSADQPTIIEVKGYFPPSERAKLVAIRSANPASDIRLVFGADNKLARKKDDRRYSDWCTEHEFKYAVRIIPKSWLKEFK